MRRWLASLPSEGDDGDGGRGGGATQSATQGKMLRGEVLLLLLLLPPDCGLLLAGLGLRFPSRSPINLRTNKYRCSSRRFRYIKCCRVKHRRHDKSFVVCDIITSPCRSLECRHKRPRQAGQRCCHGQRRQCKAQGQLRLILQGGGGASGARYAYSHYGPHLGNDELHAGCETGMRTSLPVTDLGLGV